MFLLALAKSEDGLKKPEIERFLIVRKNGGQTTFKFFSKIIQAWLLCHMSFHGHQFQ